MHRCCFCSSFLPKAELRRTKIIKSQQLQILQLRTFNIRTLICPGVQRRPQQRMSDRSSLCCSPAILSEGTRK